MKEQWGASNGSPGAFAPDTSARPNHSRESDQTAVAGAGPNGSQSDAKSLCGFDYAVLANPLAVAPSAGAASAISKGGKNERILIIPKEAPLPSHNDKPAKAANRKWASTAPTFHHNGKAYRINAKGKGVYTQIMAVLIERQIEALASHSRVLVIRFDHHPQRQTDNSEAATGFRKVIAYNLRTRWGIKSFGFVWAREQEKAKHQHYHWALFLDGDKIRHPAKLLATLKAAAEKRDQSVSFGERCYHWLSPGDEEAQQAAAYHLSYLAKVRGKGYRPSQAKDYGSSHLKRSQ